MIDEGHAAATAWLLDPDALRMRTTRPLRNRDRRLQQHQSVSVICTTSSNVQSPRPREGDRPAVVVGPLPHQRDRRHREIGRGQRHARGGTTTTGVIEPPGGVIEDVHLVAPDAAGTERDDRDQHRWRGELLGERPGTDRRLRRQCRPCPPPAPPRRAPSTASTITVRRIEAAPSWCSSQRDTPATASSAITTVTFVSSRRPQSVAVTSSSPPASCRGLGHTGGHDDRHADRWRPARSDRRGAHPRGSDSERAPATTRARADHRSRRRSAPRCTRSMAIHSAAGYNEFG